MCLATPDKVIRIKGKKAIVQSGRQADLSLVKNIKVGDYLLIHEDLALNKVPESDAKKILSMINELNK